MSDNFSDYVEQCQQRTAEALERELDKEHSEFSHHPSRGYLLRLREAMRYALTGGGKRVRPMLVYAACEAVTNKNGNNDAIERIACAVEMIHCYSLVHDDLPAMDDDELRRGKPTCHIAFDEATAILAGDALQARAFELLTQLPDTPADISLKMIATLSAAAGPRGMVGGQAIDLGALGQDIELAHLETMHQLKTGALIRAATTLGGLSGGASPEQLAALDRYGEAIGLSFQVQDDILDIESDTDTLGKPQGADIALNKPTYPKLMGLSEAKEFAQQLHERAITALEGFDSGADHLRQLSHYIIARSH